MTDFYKKKKKFFKRFNNYLCPLCMSDLKVVNNKYECTGEKLELWRQKTDEFLSMNEEQKKEYLKNIQDVDIFMEWTKKDRIEYLFGSVLNLGNELHYKKRNNRCVSVSLESHSGEIIFEGSLSNCLEYLQSLKTK